MILNTIPTALAHPLLMGMVLLLRVDVLIPRRNGGFTQATAYDGVKYNLFYRTPTEFFSGSTDGDAADTGSSIFFETCLIQS